MIGNLRYHLHFILTHIRFNLKKKENVIFRSILIGTLVVYFTF